MGVIRTLVLLSHSVVVEEESAVAMQLPPTDWTEDLAEEQIAVDQRVGMVLLDKAIAAVHQRLAAVRQTDSAQEEEEEAQERKAVMAALRLLLDQAAVAVMGSQAASVESALHTEAEAEAAARGRAALFSLKMVAQAAQVVAVGVREQMALQLPGLQTPEEVAADLDAKTRESHLMAHPEAPASSSSATQARHAPQAARSRIRAATRSTPSPRPAHSR
jgi:hypothetical protein